MKKIKLLILLFIVICFTSCYKPAFKENQQVLIKSLNVKGVVIKAFSHISVVRYMKDSNYYEITFYDNELELIK